MPVEYAQNQALVDAVMAVVNDETYDEFQPIREQELQFQIASMVATNKDDEIIPTTGEPVVVRRILPADAVFLKGHFRVYICQCRWDSSSEVQQTAMLHRALMRVNVEKTLKGAIKIGTRKPDVTTFQETIMRFGAWEDSLIQLRNNLQTAQKRAKEVAAEAGKAK